MFVYRKAKSVDVVDSKGNPSMCVNVCATFVLSKRSTPTTFEQACGTHRDDAQTDTKGVSVMLFDQNELLWYKIFVEK